MNACFTLLLGIGISQAQDLETGYAEVVSDDTTVGYESPYDNNCGICDDYSCCEDDRDIGHCQCRSTCDMPPHFAYPPKYHGYYYFQPYNYTHVLQHIELMDRLKGDPKAPYATTIFESIYSEGVYEEEKGFNRVPRPFPSISKQLPDLQELLKD